MAGADRQGQGVWHVLLGPHAPGALERLQQPLWAAFLPASSEPFLAVSLLVQQKGQRFPMPFRLMAQGGGARSAAPARGVEVCSENRILTRCCGSAHHDASILRSKVEWEGGELDGHARGFVQDSAVILGAVFDYTVDQAAITRR